MNTQNTRSINIKIVAITVLGLTLALLTIHLLIDRTQDPLNVIIKRQAQQSLGYRQEWQQKGILSANDYARLDKISIYIQRRQTISDDDLNFWIALLQQGPLIKTPANWSLFYTDVLGLGVGRKHLSLAEQKKMYDAVLPFLSNAGYTKSMDPDDNAGTSSYLTTQKDLVIGNEEIAALLLAQTLDPRALGVLRNTAHNSPSPSLRQTAQEYYDKLAMVLHRVSASPQQKAS